eukprot:244632-Prymnesium_polylepis.1
MSDGCHAHKTRARARAGGHPSWVCTSSEHLISAPHQCSSSWPSLTFHTRSVLLISTSEHHWRECASSVAISYLPHARGVVAVEHGDEHAPVGRLALDVKLEAVE